MKHLFAGLLILTVALAGDSPAYAQKAGGKSYSSGNAGSTSGKSYSSGGNTKGSSFATGGNNGKGSTFSVAQQPAGGKKYSSGAPPVKTDPVKADPPAGKKYSSGAPPASVDPPKTDPAGKKYSSGNPPPPTGPPDAAANNNSRKPSGVGYNNALSNDAKHVESQKRYEAATAPKATYTSKGTDGKTVEKPITPAQQPQVQVVRRYVTHERYVTYDNRASVFYGGYYSHPVYYHDSFSPFLMGWILSDAWNSHQRALWMYHYQPVSAGGTIDDARYAELLRRDATLQAEIDALRRQNVARDPAYVPPQLSDNPDLMFNKEFVDASYNPVEVPANSQGSGGSGAGTFFFWLFIIIVGLTVAGVFIYFLFLKDY